MQANYLHPDAFTYLFCHRHQYLQGLKDYCDLTGHIPLLPRYAFGNWWSRFHPYGRLTGETVWKDKARDMASRLLGTIGMHGNTPLTLDGKGWSMKYNLLWDKVLKLGLLPEGFYEAELRSYLPRMNRYGLPLDSRADYTKSDWICWVAAMAEDIQTRQALLEPIVRMLDETPSRVAFSDWYDTKTGRYRHFIARSVQGGVFAPMLRML